MKRYSFVFLLLYVSCYSPPSKFLDRPSKQARTYTTKLRTDGIYLGYVFNDLKQVYEEKSLFVFYSNGVALSSAAVYQFLNKFGDTIKVDKRSFSYDDIYYKKMNVFDGGGYSIIDSVITIQYFTTVPGLKWSMFTYRGIIKNDSTIFITYCKGNDRPDWCTTNFYLNFVEFQKPDSINNLMKKKWYWEKPN